MKNAWGLLLLLLPGLVAAAPAAWFLEQDPALAERLASRHRPAEDGALGRNREAYFHARFQMGVHQLATAAVLHHDPRPAEAALRAIAYGLDQQSPDGGFRVEVPARLRQGTPPRAADLASGSAFFLASAGPALLVLESPAAQARLPAAVKQQARALHPKLEKSLGYLRAHQSVLMRADAHAPNRLLFDALALHSLGLLLSDGSAMQDAHAFTRAALALQHPDGYFIEGGGSDSSYNGVAIAVGYRLLALDPGNRALALALARASDWQLTRIGADGEISVAGNTRVFPGGESFLGKAKGVDVAHTVEGLMLAAAARGDDCLLDGARRVARFYAGN